MSVGSKLEYCYTLYLEFSRAIAGFITQCLLELPISWTNADGTKRSLRHRPDVVVFNKPPASGDLSAWRPAKLVEVKCESELKKKIAAGDGQYVYNEKEKKWRSPSAEAAAEEMYGFGYEVLVEQDLRRLVDPVLLNNAEFIHDYCLPSARPVAAETARRVRDCVALDPGITLQRLYATLPGVTSNDFFKLLADEVIYVPLDRCQLDMPSDVRVFSDQVVADAYLALHAAPGSGLFGHKPTLTPGELLKIDGRQLEVVLCTDNTLHCKDENGASVPLSRANVSRFIKNGSLKSRGTPKSNTDEAQKILLRTPVHKLKEALALYAPIKDRVEGKKRRIDAHEAKLSAKARFWLPRARAAHAVYPGMGFIGCIDRKDQRGRRALVLSPGEEMVLKEGVDLYASDVAPSMVSAYSKYRDLCQKKSLPPVSLKTFRKRIQKFVKAELVRRREGAAAAAQHAAPVSSEELLDGVGRFFMHVAHVDEFIIDLALVFPELGTAIGQVWCVALLDGYSRTALSLVVTFYSPGYATTMMALRECVRRWKRLPRAIMMDNGSGFKNASLNLFLSYYNVRPIWRPIEAPRWGAQIERFGGSTNQRISNELPGATKVANKHRRISKTHLPANKAIYSLREAEGICTEWAYEEYDTLPHAGLNGQTPREVREKSLRDHGDRMHLEIECNEHFHIMSLPAPDGDGTALVQAHEGVQVANFCYWHDDFKFPDVEETRVQVRWDPFDITYVYAFIRGEWHKCECLKLRKLKSLSPEDRCVVSMEIRHGRSKYSRDYQQVLRRVRDFLDTKEKSPEEREKLLQAKQSAKLAMERWPKIDLGDGSEPPSAVATVRTPPALPPTPTSASAKSASYKELS